MMTHKIALCYNETMYKQVCQNSISLLLIILILVACFGCASTLDSEGLVISEVVSSNRMSLSTEGLGSCDWVEFYNGSDEAVNLEGYGFSDNLRKLHKFVFGDVTIPAYGYLVLYLTNADGAANPDAPIAGFGLSKSGENLFLTDPYYGLLQELTLPALPTDVAYARRTDGTYGFTLTTTPNGPQQQVFDALSKIYQLPESNLAISEILPYPLNGEAWVELYNASTEPIRLERFYLGDKASSPNRFQLPSGTLEPDAYVICLLNGKSGVTAVDGGIQANFRIREGETSIYLADASGEIMDSLTWSERLATGISVVADEEYTAFPTPGGDNSTRTFSEPNIAESGEAGEIIISEVLQNNKETLTDQDGDRIEWVELYNSSSEPVMLKGYYLSDEAAAPYQYALPDQTLGANEYLVVFLSGKNRVKDGEIHASFKLASDESALYLTNDMTFTCETFSLYPDCPEDISIGRAQDGGMVFYAVPSPWYPNGAAFPDLNDARNAIGDVTINEVFTNAGYGDPTPDWIELKNNTDQAVSLKGWYLSDTLSDLRRWQFPDTVVPPCGYTIIHVGEEVVVDATKTPSFSIAASGETLFLSNPDGSRVDSFETGAVRAGNSVGRTEDAERTRVFYTVPTPGESNAGDAFEGYAPKPVFSETALRHDAPFSLTFHCSNPNAAIYYTTDGAEPTEQSARYTAPLTITQNTVIRAASFSGGRLRSDIETQTFLINVNHELPILCLSTDPANLAGADSMLANKNRYNEFWERPVVMEYDSGEDSFSANCGFRLHGNMSRQSNGFGKASMKLCFRPSYGDSVLNYPLFENGRTTVFHDLLVRNGSDMRLAVIRDELITNIAYKASPYLCVMASQYVATYINGEYMGLYCLKESIGAGYFAEHFGVSEESVEMHRPLQEENEDFLALMRYAKGNDLNEEEHYRYLEDRIDFDGMIDWLIYEAYVTNIDVAVNVRCYRSVEYDGKWHYALFDLDLSMKGDANLDGLTKGAWNIIPRKLLRVPRFQDRFLKRFASLMEHELSQKSVLAEYDSLISQIDEEMVLERARWPKSVNKTWQGYAEDLRQEIQKDRASQLKQSLADYMSRPLSEIEAYFSQP